MHELRNKLKEDGTFLATKVISLNAKGFAVLDLQKRLCNAGYEVTLDGDFGPATRQAVIRFQTDWNLKPDGIAGRITLKALNDAAKTNKYLTQSQILDAAEKAGIAVPLLLAVPELESRNRGFLNSGKPVILYERHIMYRTLPDYGLNPEDYTNNPGLVNSTPGGYTGYETEWLRLENAMAIHKEAAYESASWGITQIMGFHWEALGFQSVSDYVRYMCVSEVNQMDCFIRFLATNSKMFNALKENDVKTFAYYYNGRNYAKNEYDVKLSKAIAKFTQEIYG